jgi:peptidoglycan/LPS O-acetylase OafA/YrhL
MSSKNSTGQVGVRHISSIDGLRAIAVTAVVLYHLGISWIPGGFLGVDLFFVISGYVITRLILDSINQSSALDLRAFYAARLRRIYPGFLFMVVCTIIFIGVWAPEAIKRFTLCPYWNHKLATGRAPSRLLRNCWPTSAAPAHMVTCS